MTSKHCDIVYLSYLINMDDTTIKPVRFIRKLIALDKRTTTRETNE